MAQTERTPRHKEEELPLSRTVEEARARIRCFSARARLGQWGLIIFGLLSIAAFRFGPLLETLPQHWLSVLGPAPPVRLISIALVVYAFAALIYILARMMEGGKRYRGWSHLGYLGGFYLFYAYAGALQENFWAVLAAGLTILGLEQYRLWSHCQEVIRQERQTFGLDGAGRQKPPD
jgi:hypothetical protein